MDINTSEAPQVANGKKKKQKPLSTQQTLQLPAAAKTVHHALMATRKSIKQTPSSQWNVWKRYYCLSLGRIPLSNIYLHWDAHTYNHSFMQSSDNKTFLPEVVELIAVIFSFSHRVKIKSLVWLYEHSQSLYWQTESTYLSITIANYQTNLTIPWRQQLNAIFSAWANHLTFYPCPYFKDFFILTSFHIFPLVYFLMSSK